MFKNGVNAFLQCSLVGNRLELSLAPDWISSSASSTRPRILVFISREFENGIRRVKTESQIDSSFVQGVHALIQREHGETYDMSCPVPANCCVINSAVDFATMSEP